MGTALTKWDGNLAIPVRDVARAEAALRSVEERIEAMIPAGLPIKAEKIIATAITAIERTPYLYKCSGESIVAAVCQGAEFGWSFSPILGQAHLVPYSTKRGPICQLIPGYRGLMDLVRRAADVEVIDADAVFAGDVFAWEKGTAPRLEHTPRIKGGSRRAEDLTHVYSVAFHKNGLPTFQVMDKTEVLEVRARSKAHKSAKEKGYPSIWDTDFVPMAIKSVIRRHSKYLPISAEKASLIERAFALDADTDLAPARVQVSTQAKLEALRAEVGGMPSAENGNIARPIIAPEHEPKPEVAEPERGAGEYDASKDTRPITEPQRKQLYALLKKIDASTDEMAAFVRLGWGVASSKEMNRAQIDEAFKLVDTLKSHDALVDWMDYTASNK